MDDKRKYDDPDTYVKKRISSQRRYVWIIIDTDNREVFPVFATHERTDGQGYTYAYAGKSYEPFVFSSPKEAKIALDALRNLKATYATRKVKQLLILEWP